MEMTKKRRISFFPNRLVSQERDGKCDHVISVQTAHGGEQDCVVVRASVAAAQPDTSI